MKYHLDEETQAGVDNIPSEFFEAWGRDGVWSPCNEEYADKTVVRSGSDALEAFEAYTEYFNHIIDSWEPTSDRIVLVPCGASKPIGSSTIHQKKIRAIRNGGLADADIVIVSEPCTIVPPEYRLSLPAANYDFPPEYTVREDHPEVFELFTDRLAEWMDAMEYDEIFPYLISGHQNKFDVAYEKMETSPPVYNIPSASYNDETESYSGDRFKKQSEMNEKVRAVCKYKSGDDVVVSDGFDAFYRERWE